jgi:hypothetical protein
MNFLREAWGAERHDVQEVAALASRNAKLVGSCAPVDNPPAPPLEVSRTGLDCVVENDAPVANIFPPGRFERRNAGCNGRLARVT